MRGYSMYVFHFPVSHSNTMFHLVISTKLLLFIWDICVYHTQLVANFLGTELKGISRPIGNIMESIYTVGVGLYIPSPRFIVLDLVCQFLFDDRHTVIPVPPMINDNGLPSVIETFSLTIFHNPDLSAKHCWMRMHLLYILGFYVFLPNCILVYYKV